MKLALTLILALVCVAILVRGYFDEIRPFGIVRESFRLLPRLLRTQPLVVAWLLIPSSRLRWGQ